MKLTFRTIVAVAALGALGVPGRTANAQQNVSALSRVDGAKPRNVVFTYAVMSCGARTTTCTHAPAEE